MSSSGFLDLELCLSRRADLVTVVVSAVLESRLSGLPCPAPDVVAHVVDTQNLVRLHFLVKAESAVMKLRSSLIAAGEMLIDHVLAELPWEKPPLVMIYGKEPTLRLEVYARCTASNETDWYEGHGIPLREVPLIRSMTGFLRGSSWEVRRLKTVLPILIHDAHAPETKVGQDIPGNETSPLQPHLWLQQRATEAKARGLLTYSELSVADQELLRQLQTYVADTASVLDLDPRSVIERLLQQFGFREIERDYLTLMGSEMQALA
jgi:hypothetical protein